MFDECHTPFFLIVSFGINEMIAVKFLAILSIAPMIMVTDIGQTFVYSPSPFTKKYLVFFIVFVICNANDCVI